MRNSAETRSRAFYDGAISATPRTPHCEGHLASYWLSPYKVLLLPFYSNTLILQVFHSSYALSGDHLEELRMAGSTTAWKPGHDLIMKVQPAHTSRHPDDATLWGSFNGKRLFLFYGCLIFLYKNLLLLTFQTPLIVTL